MEILQEFNYENFVGEKIRNMVIMNKIYESQKAQISSVNKNIIQDLIDNLFLDSMTWMCARWEKTLNIPTIESDSYDDRRSRIIAKLRGSGTCTIAHIKDVAKSYNCGDVDVIEDYENYTITIKFISTIGVPTRIDDFESTIREIVPAHLKINYEFTYRTWQELFDNCTWQIIKDEKLNTWKDVMTFPK